MNRFAILTPYMIPVEMTGKRVNIGDGFILRAIERLIGPFSGDRVFTSRAVPSVGAVSRMRDAGTVILGGANQLNDHFAVWPGATAEDVRASGLRFVPFGVGLDGAPDKNVALSDGAIETLRAIHERAEFSSWRCLRTAEIVRRALPDIADRALMTGCPVVYDRPLLEGQRFHEGERIIAVTATERDDFWSRETATLRSVARLFPKARRVFVQHQDFKPETAFERRHGRNPLVAQFISRRARLRQVARSLGYEVAAPQSADAAIAFYREADMHFGSRLHAHLLFLSLNKRSFLTKVDERMTGFSEYLGFPLHDPAAFDLGFDFEIVRRNAQRTFATMQTFVRSLGVEA